MNDKAKLDFIVDLHKRNSDKLGFIPKPYLQKLIENDQVFLSLDGGLSSGFCVIGNGNSFNLKIYQHCIEQDLRRLDHGRELFSRIEFIARKKGFESITLRCRENLEANKFWKALNFNLYSFEEKQTQRTKKGINKWIYTIRNPIQGKLL